MVRASRSAQRRSVSRACRTSLPTVLRTMNRSRFGRAWRLGQTDHGPRVQENRGGQELRSVFDLIDASRTAGSPAPRGDTGASPVLKLVHSS